MNLSAALDVAIGLVLMYLLLALFCTIVNELIARAMRWRAKGLRADLRELLHDPNAAWLFEQFKAHPLVQNVFRDQKAVVSQLHSSAFANALLQAVAPPGGDQRMEALSFQSVKASIAAMTTHPQLQSALVSLAREAGDTLEGLQERLEAWFDTRMERVADAYGRKLRWVSMVVALVITVAFNADTLSVATRLWGDSALRLEIAAVAEKVDAAGQTTKTLEELRKDLQVFPLGWTTGPAGELQKPDVDCGRWFALVGAMLLGWSLTALAVSLGAPFWFDVLRKTNALRTAMKPATAGGDGTTIAKSKAAKGAPAAGKEHG